MKKRSFLSAFMMAFFASACVMKAHQQYPIQSQAELLLSNPTLSQHYHPDMLINVFASIGAPTYQNMLLTDLELRKQLGAQSTIDGKPTSNTALSAVTYKRLFTLFENACSESIALNPQILFPEGLSNPSKSDIENIYLRMMSRYPAAEDWSKIQEILSGVNNKALGVCVYILTSLEGISV